LVDGAEILERVPDRDAFVALGAGERVLAGHLVFDEVEQAVADRVLEQGNRGSGRDGRSR
jgi:hypothetical protein